MSSYVGEAAALAAALGWTISAVCWTLAGKHVGSLVVCSLRLFLALPLFMLYSRLTLGEAVPLSQPGHAWLWLGLSGVLGFFVCDICLFRSFLLIGPRLALMIFSLAPLVSSFFGWVLLSEHLSPVNFVGMVIALCGVVWVVRESPNPRADAAQARTPSWHGGTLAMLAMVTQGVSTVIAKQGMAGDVAPVAATGIRLLTGTLCFAVLTPLLGRNFRYMPALRSPRIMTIMLIGTIAGPCAGVALLMFSLVHIPTGLAMTFISLTPVMVIPFTILLFKERVGTRTVAGSVIAFIGMALLFWR